MTRPTDSGVTLTISDIDEMATRIADMWNNRNTQRQNALLLNEEARQYLLSTDINTTSANILPHKNRTHIPKLTELADALITQYFEATLGSAEWFRFEGTTDTSRERSLMVEAWLRTKLEQINFRQTVGRQLITDFVYYGNVFAEVDYVVETNDNDELVYKGPKPRRVGVMDLVMDPQGVSFRKSPKIVRQLIHISELAAWPEMFPNANFNETAIRKAIEARKGDTLDEWVEVLKERGITFDGFNTYNEYFKGDLVEVLVYRGDVFNPETGQTKRNRVVHVVDRTFIIRDEPNNAPTGFDGLHHAGWRIRPDNLWAQGPMDNLVGMQYRIDHLENLKADVFDLLAHPVILVKGPNVQEPEDGYAPGATYYMDVDEQVEFLVPDPTVLQSDNQIQLIFATMEQMAGVLPNTRGQRTPGEKTAFEVGNLDANASRFFLDKARQFEMLLEGILQESYQLMMKYFDGVDFIETFDDIEGEAELREISIDEIKAIGRFKAVGSKHWSKRNRETVEMREFQLGPMQDPKIRQHVSGLKLAEFYEKRLQLEDDEIIEEFAGVAEDVNAQLVARAQAQQLSERVGLTGPEDAAPEEQQQPGAQSFNAPSSVQSGQPQDIVADLAGQRGP